MDHRPKRLPAAGLLTGVHRLLCMGTPFNWDHWDVGSTAPKVRRKWGVLMYGTAWSLLPFVIVIPLAMLTRQVLPSLVVGLLVGAYLLHPSLLGGVQGALDAILHEMTTPDNVRLLVFLYGFGAFVGLLRATGGVAGFARWMEARANSRRSGFTWLWLSGLVTFMAPDFRIMTAGPMMRSVCAKLKLPAEQVAFVLDATATPLTAVVPIGTVFVGYQLALISAEASHHGVVGPPARLLFLSLPFNFFAWLMLAYTLYQSFFVWSRGQAEKADPVAGRSLREAAPPEATPLAERPATGVRAAYTETAGELVPTLPSTGARGARYRLSRRPREHSGPDKVPDPLEAVSQQVPPSLVNLLLPLATLLSLTLLLTWWDGRAHSATLLGALVAADAARAMLTALFITLIVSILWYALQRQPLGRTLFGFVQGGNEMMGVNLLLIMVWADTAVAKSLGFSEFITRSLGHLVPPALMVPALFAFSCVISYVIGSTFGTWGILLPLGFSLAAMAHASLPLVTGAVFAGGTFGGFASPLSDNTVATATVLKLPLMPYARSKLKAGSLVAGASLVLFAVAGWFIHVGA